MNLPRIPYDIIYSIRIPNVTFDSIYPVAIKKDIKLSKTEWDNLRWSEQLNMIYASAYDQYLDEWGPN